MLQFIVHYMELYILNGFKFRSLKDFWEFLDLPHSKGAVETYSYDSQNRLVGYSSPTTSATYAYDVLDRRIAKTVDGTVTAYVYDPWGLDSTASDVLLTCPHHEGHL